MTVFKCPPACLEQAGGNKAEIKCLGLQYMNKCPNYRVLKGSASFEGFEKLDGFL